MEWENNRIDDILENAQIWICVLDIESSDEFIPPRALEFIACFVRPEVLKSMAEDLGVLPGELFLTNFVPDNPSIRSGDFGEIITKYILEEWQENLIFPGYRWRFKKSKNEPIQGCDLIGYIINNPDIPSPDDVLVMTETKTLSSRTDLDIASKVFEDAIKHYISDLASNLFQLSAILRQDGFEQEAKTLNRFLSPHTDGLYTRWITPVIVHDFALWDEECWQRLPKQYSLPEPYSSHEEMIFILIKIHDLVDFMEKMSAYAAVRVDND